MFKIIPPLDTYPRVVQHAQTPFGKFLMLGVFAIGLRIHGLHAWAPVICILGAIMLFPKYRNLLAALGTLYYLLFDETWVNWNLIQRIATSEGLSASWTAMPMHYFWLAVIFLFYGAFWLLAKRPGKSLISRRPVLVLFTFYSAVLVIASSAPLPSPVRAALWAFLVLAGPYLRCWCYTLQERHTRGADSFPMQSRAWMPFWTVAFQPSVTPIPKGAANLRKIESKTPKELAITHLKGLKLLYWTLIMQVSAMVFGAVVHGETHHSLARFGAFLPQFGIPTLVAALDRTAAGQPFSRYLCWGAVVSHMLASLLSLAIGGNLAVACCRMAGFRALRYIYKPLESGSIAEFWNRYVYYFKELLVEFFFYPTYLRYFRDSPKLRLAAATFAAACFGNWLTHFLWRLDYVAEFGLWRALVTYQVYAFYCVVLAGGIVISQLTRKKGGSQETSRYRRMIATIPALVFFSLLDIFDQDRRAASLGTCMTFLGQLFSIGR
jgi:hypothetical protein